MGAQSGRRGTVRAKILLSGTTSPTRKEDPDMRIVEHVPNFNNHRTGIEPQESDLLVPFESQHIPADYKEYYKTKRNNFFACVQGFPEMWKCYVDLDAIWLREFGDLGHLGRVNQVFPLALY